MSPTTGLPLPGGMGIEIRTSRSSRPSSSSSYSMLTSHEPSAFCDGQQLIERGIMLSSCVCNRHLSTPSSLLTGNGRDASLSPISALSLNSFLSTLGCVLYWNPLSSAIFRRSRHRATLASLIRRNISPFTSIFCKPPSLLATNKMCSSTRMCMLSVLTGGATMVAFAPEEPTGRCPCCCSVCTTSPSATSASTKSFVFARPPPSFIPLLGAADFWDVPYDDFVSSMRAAAASLAEYPPVAEKPPDEPVDAMGMPPYWPTELLPNPVADWDPRPLRAISRRSRSSSFILRFISSFASRSLFFWTIRYMFSSWLSISVYVLICARLTLSR
eukprot:Opistho-2@56920